MSYEDPVNQRSMVLDAPRNAAYFHALRQFITPQSIVMDLGAGLGVLGLMAAKLGAARVYLVEPATNLEVAMEIARDNGLSDRVVLVPSTIEQAKFIEPVDIIVSVFTGNFLLEEDLLPSLFFARDQYLKPGGYLLPDQGRMMVQPVSMPEYFDRQITRWQTDSAVISHDVMMKYAVNSLYYDQFGAQSYTAIASPKILQSIDFKQATEAACRATLEFVVEDDQVMHGFLGWFDMTLGTEWLSTGPKATPTHWSQVYLPLDAPQTLAQGDLITIRMNRPERGEWSWQVECDGKLEQHSTFLSQPFSRAQLAQRSGASKPKLSEQGEMVVAVLQLFNRDQTAEQIAEEIRAQWPESFVDAGAALRFVQQQIVRFGHV